MLSGVLLLSYSCCLCLSRQSQFTSLQVLQLPSPRAVFLITALSKGLDHSARHDIVLLRLNDDCGTLTLATTELSVIATQHIYDTVGEI